MKREKDVIYIFCDGGCRNNQQKDNIGGYGIVMMFNNYVKEFKYAERNTTNNIMELRSCIDALKLVRDRTVKTIVTSDSNYMVKGINEWVHNWAKNDWCKKKPKKPIENKELWQELFYLKNDFDDVIFIHCKGHADNEGNNRADKLANLAMDEIL